MHISLTRFRCETILLERAPTAKGAVLAHGVRKLPRFEEMIKLHSVNMLYSPVCLSCTVLTPERKMFSALRVGRSLLVFPPASVFARLFLSNHFIAPCPLIATTFKRRQEPTTMSTQRVAIVTGQFSLPTHSSKTRPLLTRASSLLETQADPPVSALLSSLTSSHSPTESS